MSAKGSVSPKERVNIVYKSDIGDAKKEVELPFKVLVLGDFNFREDGQGPLENREIIDVNKDNIDDVLKSQELKLNINVPDQLSGQTDSELNISLKFDTMKDFDPDQIIEQVPALQKVIDLRKAVLSLKGPLGNIPAFRRKIQEILDDENSRKQLMKELGI
jgi:type VI secretion system protein ImpB